MDRSVRGVAVTVNTKKHFSHTRHPQICFPQLCDPIKLHVDGPTGVCCDPPLCAFDAPRATSVPMQPTKINLPTDTITYC